MNSYQVKFRTVAPVVLSLYIEAPDEETARHNAWMTMLNDCDAKDWRAEGVTEKCELTIEEEA